jgi:D-glycero-alpha-D-manno-heptose-7-phosphate kinase
MLIARTPVRVSFGGGGTDLPSFYEAHGGAVLSTSINKYFYTMLTGREDDLIQVISSDIRVVEAWRNVSAAPSSEQMELQIPFAALKALQCDIGLNLFLASEIPPGTGLGSSAAVCVNLLHVLSAYLHRPLSKYELAETAFHIARDVLGKPVGKQDEYAAAFGGLNFIHFEAGAVRVERLHLEIAALRELEDNLLLFFTGAGHDSWVILKDQENSSRRADSETVEALLALKKLALEMKEALLAREFSRFGSLLDRGWQQKKRLSSQVSNSRIDSLYDLARRNGALGGKITGAGGGGFLLLYSERDSQPRLVEALKDAGLRQMHFDFDLNGSQIIYDDPFMDQDVHGGTQWTYIPAGAFQSVFGKA